MVKKRNHLEKTFEENLIQEPNEVEHIEETSETKVEENDIEFDQQDSKKFLKSNQS